MYRKDADRLIVRDVRERLHTIREDVAWPDWRMAVIASSSEHPSWYQHHDFRTLEALLRGAGLDMSETEKPRTFVWNNASVT
jgi:hypothetical protein